MRVIIGRGRIAPEPGLVVLAPDDAHLVASFGGWLAESTEPPVSGHRPSATVFFRSLARWLGRSAVGVVLSGIGSDGAEGLRDLRTAGAVTIAQDRATAAVYGMPKAASEIGAAVHVTPLPEIPALIQRSVAAIAAESRGNDQRGSSQ
jgi:two-component system chemotaxis response regulator CheB